MALVRVYCLDHLLLLLTLLVVLDLIKELSDADTLTITTIGIYSPEVAGWVTVDAPLLIEAAAEDSSDDARELRSTIVLGIAVRNEHTAPFVPEVVDEFCLEIALKWFFDGGQVQLLMFLNEMFDAERAQFAEGSQQLLLAVLGLGVRLQLILFVSFFRSPVWVVGLRPEQRIQLVRCEVIDSPLSHLLFRQVGQLDVFRPRFLSRFTRRSNFIDLTVLCADSRQLAVQL